MKKDFFKYILALLLFGSNGVISSTISLSSAQITLLRSVIGGIALAVLFFVTGHKLTVMKHKRELLYIGISGIAMAADWLFLFEAYARIGVSLSILINYTGPIFVIVLSPLFFKEHITAAKIISLCVTVAGVLLISGQIIISGLDIWGLFCAAMSAVCYVVLVISDKMCKNVVGMENSMLQLLFTVAAVVIYTGISQGLSMNIQTSELPSILWLGIINTGLGCMFYFSSVTQLSSHTVAVCGYLEPLSSVVLSALILKKSMTVLQIVGAVLIIGGAVYGEVKGAKALRLAAGR